MHCIIECLSDGFFFYLPQFQSKIKDSRFQLAPWHSEVNPLASAFQSPAHLVGAGLATLVSAGSLYVNPHPAQEDT